MGRKSDSHSNKQITTDIRGRRGLSRVVQNSDIAREWGRGRGEGGYDLTMEIRITYSEEVMLGLKSGRRFNW